MPENLQHPSWELWYRQPAAVWEEALPVGNGRLGGMVFGGTAAERIQLNEDTLWAGFPRDTHNYDALRYLREVRELIFQGNYELAEGLLENKMLGRNAEPYQPLGDLHIHQHLEHDVKHYRRKLDLDTGIALTEWQCGETVYTREVWVSAVDQVLVVRLVSSGDEVLTASGYFTSPHPHEMLEPDRSTESQASSQLANSLIWQGRCPSHVEDNYAGNHPQSVLYENQLGMEFAAQLQVSAEGGSITIQEGKLQVEGASSITFYVSACTAFAGFDRLPLAAEEFNQKRLSAFAAFAQTDSEQRDVLLLRERHVEDHQRLFRRVQLQLGPVDKNMMPTDVRLDVYKQGQPDPGLEALYFQYGRYLLMACSRPGTQPANLQGIWNHEVQPPWNSDYTTNINTQMNYWLAETCALSECHEPLFDLIGDLAVTGRRTAAIHYGTRGWTAHHNVDLWRLSTPTAGQACWAFWPMGGVWLVSHLWEHYAFSGDREFLRTQAYPLMKEAALFCLDWLVDGPSGHLVTAPSTSPENKFLTAAGQPCSVSMASTMDMALIRELFTRCIEAGQLLEADLELRRQWEHALTKLYPYQIGRHGQLQEWFADFEESEPGHRHVSHLYGLYPGNGINLLETPELAAACRTTLERRLAHGGGHTGWSCAWLINLHARLGEAESSYRFVHTLLARSTHPNLFDDHPPFQIDGNFGGAAGIAEMLLQSHLGELHLLPALPQAWSEGAVTGLRARGGYTVAMEWSGRLLSKATLTAAHSGVCRVRCNAPLQVTHGAGVLPVNDPGNGWIEFIAVAQETYHLVRLASGR